MTKSLESLRKEIDRIDEDLVRLLSRRMAVAAQIGEEKRREHGPLTDAEREEAVLAHVAALNEGPISDDAVKAIYRLIMSAAVAVQQADGSGIREH